MNKISFSIITATYNRQNSGYLTDCIKSVQGQVGDNFSYEHIIVNDGSVDATEKYLFEIASKDRHIVVINQENADTAKAIQAGIKVATGEYITILDDDDRLVNDSLKKRTAYIESNPGIDWFYAKARWIDDRSDEISVGYQSKYYTDHMYERMLVNNIIHGGTVVAKTKVFKQISWPDWLKRSQDYFLWLELLRPEKNLKFGFLDDFVYEYRVHEQGYTSGYVKGEKSEARLKKKIKLNNRVKSLHGDSLGYVAGVATELEEENKKLSSELDSTKKALETKTNQFIQIESENHKIKGTLVWRLATRVNNILKELKIK